MDCFTWSKEDSNWTVTGDQYNEEFKTWRGPIHNGKFRSQTLKDKRKTEETCSKYAGSTKLNVIPSEGNLEILIKSYKDQFREHMIRNGAWDVFSPPYPRNKDKNWDLLLHQSRFTVEYTKLHVQSLQNGSEADQYVVQNLTWSGVYLGSALSNTLLQKVLTLVPLTVTGPEVFVATMTTFISDSYDALEDILIHNEDSQNQK